jgi:hypothetical protein
MTGILLQIFGAWPLLAPKLSGQREQLDIRTLEFSGDEVNAFVRWFDRRSRVLVANSKCREFEHYGLIIPASPLGHVHKAPTASFEMDILPGGFASVKYLCPSDSGGNYSECV